MLNVMYGFVISVPLPHLLCFTFCYWVFLLFLSVNILGHAALHKRGSPKGNVYDLKVLSRATSQKHSIKTCGQLKLENRAWSGKFFHNFRPTLKIGDHSPIFNRSQRIFTQVELDRHVLYITLKPLNRVLIFHKRAP